MRLPAATASELVIFHMTSKRFARSKATAYFAAPTSMPLLLDFLKSPAAREILEAQGFGVIPP